MCLDEQTSLCFLHDVRSFFFFRVRVCIFHPIFCDVCVVSFESSVFALVGKGRGLDCISSILQDEGFEEVLEMVQEFAVDIGQWMASMDSLSVEADGVGAQVARLSFEKVGMNGDISAVELEYKMYMELTRKAKRR